MRKIKNRIDGLNKLSWIKWACTEAVSADGVRYYRLYTDHGNGFRPFYSSDGTVDGILWILDSQLKLFKK